MNIAASGAIAITVAALGIAARSIEAQQVVPYAYPGTPEAAAHVPASVLERYVGEWVYPDGNSVMIRLKGDTLFREIPGQLVPFVPISETRFALGPVFTADFVTDKAGGMTQILSDGVATEFRLHRKGAAPAAVTPPLPSVSVSTSILERYIGEYEFVPGQMSRTDLFIAIRLKGGTLFGFTSGMREQILTPISETRFKLGNTAIEWEFAADQSGVTLVLGSGSQQMKVRLKRPLTQFQ